MKLALCSLLFAGATVAAADPAATAINELGVDLHQRLAAAKPNANLCVSTYSIQSALAMTYAGADGETREEMAKVLHYPKGDAIHEAIPTLNKALTAITEKTTKIAADSKKWGGPSQPVTFHLANRLFGRKGFAFEKVFLDLTKDTYGAALEPTDFSQSGAATKRINDWVEKETKERIRDLIPGGFITPDTRLVLVNAVYLKAPWAHEFWDGATKSKPFHVGGGAAVDVPTMVSEFTAGYARKNGYTAISLPYSGGELHFLILLPGQRDGLADLEKKITPANLAACAKLEPQLTTIYLPKFKIESESLPLSGTLQALGMKSAFDIPQGSANFSRMAPRTPSDYLAISEVIHKTFLALDEKGTEAAAATAVLMRPKGEPPNQPKPIEVKVDRPFLFAIQHAPSGACLFLGRVTDPR
jgi:serpin B